jgi:hypothetical protein
MQLAVADVDGVHLCRAPLQQHVGESARRRAEIGADSAARIELGKAIERGLQLEPAPRDVLELFLEPQLDRRIEELTGLLHPVLARDHRAREDQRLRLGAALGEPALVHQDVGPDFQVGAGACSTSAAIRESSRSMSMGLEK